MDDDIENNDYGNEDDDDYYAEAGVEYDLTIEENEAKKAAGEETDEDEENLEEVPTATQKTKQITYVAKNERKTGNIMTKYEFARLISSAAMMYSDGLPIHKDLSPLIKGLIDPIDVAELHMKHRKNIPFPVAVDRPVHGRGLLFEQWEADELITPDELVNMGTNLELLRIIH